MKKKVLLGILYTGVIVLTLIFCLTVFKKDTNSEITESNSPNNEDVSSSPTPNPSEEITYAKSLTLNCPSTIYCGVDGEIRLLNGFIEVNPTEKLSELNITVTNELGFPTTNLSFENNTIKPKEIGTYYIVFAIPKSETEDIVKKIKIIVNIEDEQFKQIKNTVTIGQNNDISDLFEIETAGAVTTFTSNDFSINSNTITANDIKNSNLTAKIEYNYYAKYYTFYFTVKDKPEFTIIITSHSEDTITAYKGESIEVFYAIYDKEEKEVSQKVKATIDNTSVAVKSFELAPMIIIDCLKVGECVLTLTLESNPEITVQIPIEVLDK